MATLSLPMTISDTWTLIIIYLFLLFFIFYNYFIYYHNVSGAEVLALEGILPVEPAAIGHVNAVIKDGKLVWIVVG